MSDEKARLEKMRQEIAAERKKLKDEREATANGTPLLIDSVSIAVHNTGLKLYTTDGRLINSLTWEELNEMKAQITSENFLMTESSASPQTLFRETFQNFLYFCNTLYLPKEIEDVPESIVNNPQIDPNTRAFLDMVIHYEKYFEKNPQWKRPLTRFLKWMCYLYKEDALVRERIGWMFWWWIVKHGNKLIMWESSYDPKHWTPYTDGDIMRDIEGPKLATPLTPEEEKEVMKKNEEMMKNAVTMGTKKEE
jgi:hypothetical protein